MKSLIKSKGGWSKVRTVNDYSEMNDIIINNYFIDLYHIHDMEELQQLRFALDRLNNNIEDAYKECVKNAINNQWSAASMPLCVCIAAVHNHLTNLRSSKKSPGQFIEDMAERFNKKNWQELNTYMSGDSLQFSNKSFNWDSSTEKKYFWRLLYEAARAVDSYLYNPMIKSHDDVRVTNLNAYEDFLKFHPECKKEIEDFCKE